jgi:hypothetical protein
MAPPSGGAWASIDYTNGSGGGIGGLSLLVPQNYNPPNVVVNTILNNLDAKWQVVETAAYYITVEGWLTVLDHSQTDGNDIAVYVNGTLTNLSWRFPNIINGIMLNGAMTTVSFGGILNLNAFDTVEVGSLVPIGNWTPNFHLNIIELEPSGGPA